MFKRLIRFSLCLALPACVAMFCPPGSGQMQLEHTEYNDLVTKVSETASKVFASPEGRKAGASDLLAAIDQLTPLIQTAIDKPGSETSNAQYAHFLQTNAVAAQQIKQLHAQQLRLYSLFRLALNEPAALQADQDAMSKGGPSAALASIDKAGAGWLNAGQDPQAQSAALDNLCEAVKASPQPTPWQFWGDLWAYNEASSEQVAAPMLAYLQQFSGLPGAIRFIDRVQVKAKYFQLDSKPLTLEGTLVSGAHFSTAQSAGKVILITGWYPPCEPTVAALAQVQGLLAKHHAEGLEVLGIDYAQNIDAARTFLASHREYAFPTMFQPARQDDGWGCVVTGEFRFGTSTLGAEMVIDRAGVLHYIDAPLKQSGNIEAEIVKFLAEPVPAPSPVATTQPVIDAAPSLVLTASQDALVSALTPAAAPEISPQDKELHVAKVYIDSKMYDTAREKLQHIVQTYPGTPAAEQASGMLQQIGK
jgi:hypothetical protein